jgi:hypothetical protein
MDHFNRPFESSVVNEAIEIQTCRLAADQYGAGLTEATAVIGEPGAAVEHVWFRSLDQSETEGDFLAQAFAAARRLGVKTIKVRGLLAVPSPQQELP